ncbi:Fur family transcriptional regulator [Calditrichota bacterium]
MENDTLNLNKEISTENLKNILESKNVKPSFQRLSVLRYIMNHMNHPSAETIYNNLVQEIPTLSKTTIYNTLNLLAAKNIITALTISDTEVRYDYKKSEHAHFQCINCKQIYDVENQEISNNRIIDGHKIMDTQIHYKGICTNCFNQKTEHH